MTVRTGLLGFLVWMVSVVPAGAQCVGDCNGSGVVTVDEIVLGVNIALGLAASSACPALAVDGTVTIDRLIRAVNELLNGCATGPTATVTATSESTATATDTPASATDTPVATGSASPTASPTATVAASHTPTATAAATATPSPSSTASRTATRSASATPTVSPTPSHSVTPTHTGTPTVTATVTPTVGFIIIDLGPAFGVPNSTTSVAVTFGTALTIGSIELQYAFADDIMTSIGSCTFDLTSSDDVNIVTSGSTQPFTATVTPQAGTVQIPQGDVLRCNFQVSASAKAGSHAAALSGTVMLSTGETIPFESTSQVTLTCTLDEHCTPPQTCQFGTCANP